MELEISSHEYKPVILDGKYNPDLEFIIRLSEYWLERGITLDSPHVINALLNQSMRERIRELDEETNDRLYENKKGLDFIDKNYGELTIGEFIQFHYDYEDSDYINYLKSKFSLDDKVFSGPLTLGDIIENMKQGTPIGIHFYGMAYDGGFGWNYIKKKD